MNSDDWDGEDTGCIAYLVFGVALLVGGLIHFVLDVTVSDNVRSIITVGLVAVSIVVSVVLVVDQRREPGGFFKSGFSVLVGFIWLVVLEILFFPLLF